MSREPLTVEVPAWVEDLDDESLHTDVLIALTRRARAVQSGAMRSPERRALLRRADALLARIEKRPSTRHVLILIGEVDALYASAALRATDEHRGTARRGGERVNEPSVRAPRPPRTTPRR